MWISSLVVTLPPFEEQATVIRKAIESVPVFQLGGQIADRLPVVLEVEDGAQARYWYEWVSGLNGVVKVDLAFVSLEDVQNDEEIQCHNDVTEKADC
jgi:nitrate reductase NapAB chaperone NapD